MKPRKIYLDSCIFVAYFMKEVGKIEKINEFFKSTICSKVNFFTSEWTLTELVKVLIKEKGESSKKVAEYIQKLQRTKRINDIKFSWSPVSKKENYDFDEFFYDVQKVQLEYKGSLGDSIHTVIMRNNNIKTILTTDSEFDGMKGMIVINPLKTFEEGKQHA